MYVTSVCKLLRSNIAELDFCTSDATPRGGADLREGDTRMEAKEANPKAERP